MDSRSINYLAHALRTIFLWLVLFLVLFFPPWVFAEQTIAVLYPQIRAPYRDIFAQTIKGIRLQSAGKVHSYGLQKNTSLAELRAWLTEHDSSIAIVLGRQGLKLAQDLSNTIPVVAGAVLSAPGSKSEKIPGISLTPDPNQLFSRLRQLAPKVERVMVVYNDEISGSLVSLARIAARANSLKLQAIKVENLKAAAKQYQGFFEADYHGSTALWLLQDRSSIDGKLILPLILKQSWKKRIVVFSSNPAYVKRGVLFSLYPDNVAMGKSLARLASRRLSSKAGERIGMGPLQDLLMAVNLRTAGHLGLKLSGKLRKEINLVFPSQ